MKNEQNNWFNFNWIYYNFIKYTFSWIMENNNE